MQHLQKTGGYILQAKGLSPSAPFLQFGRSNVSTCFPAIPFPFNHLRTLLHNGRHVSAFLSITCALFPSRRRVYPPSSHFGTHPLRIPRSPCSTIPLIFIQLRGTNFASPLFSYSSVEWGVYPSP